MSDSGSPTNTASLPPVKKLHVVAAVISHGGMILAAKRHAGGPSGLKWEFPGGKVETGETPVAALAREIQEELGLEIIVGSDMGTFSTLLGTLQIDLHCFHCQASTKDVRLAVHSEVRWLPLQELSRLDWALPDFPVLNVLGGA